MSSPPRTPPLRPKSSHRRHPSSLDMSHRSPTTPRRLSSRRSSGYGQPLTPHLSHQLSQEFAHSSPGRNFDGGGDGGLGNLADELGDVWDDDEDEADFSGEEMDQLDELQESGSRRSSILSHRGDHALSSPSSPSSHFKSNVSPAASRKSNSRSERGGRHMRQRSLYGGSEYGDESDFDLENGGLSHGLERQMAAVEGLVRRGLEENGSANDKVVERVCEKLKDLGSQAVIETGATRLKTAHDALTTHLTHQSRVLTSLTSSFTGPRAIYPDPETIDALTPLISSTLSSLPHSSPEPIFALSQLTLSTRELLQHLSNVSDSLHMSRQAHNDAARRLRVAKEQVQDWKRDAEASEEGVRYLESGEWDRRLGEREAETTCRGVVDGFEKACEVWRERLVGALSASA